MSSRDIGLIAGQGHLPILVARGIRAAGGRGRCVGLSGQFDAALPEECDTFAQAGILRIGRWSRLLRKWNVDEAIMVGRVAKARMHDPWRLVRQLPDLRTLQVWYRRLRHDRRNAAVLAAVADELQRGGVTLIDSTTYIKDHVATTGAMGSVQPTSQQLQDVEFGWPLLEGALDLGIGQSMVVRERDVIAVEAVEGTDEMIRRAGTLCHAKGWTLLKSANDSHDRRADVPTIGLATITAMKAAGGTCIAVGTDRAILIDKPEILAAANSAGIALVGVEHGQS